MDSTPSRRLLSDAIRGPGRIHHIISETGSTTVRQLWCNTRVVASTDFRGPALRLSEKAPGLLLLVDGDDVNRAALRVLTCLCYGSCLAIGGDDDVRGDGGLAFPFQRCLEGIRVDLFVGKGVRVGVTLEFIVLSIELCLKF